MDQEEALQTDFAVLLDLERDPATYAFFRLLVGDTTPSDIRAFNIGTCVRVCYGVFATCRRGDCRDEVIQLIYDICADEDRSLTELFAVLKDHDADFNAINAYGNTCLVEVCRLFREPYDIVKYLVEECGADVPSLFWTTCRETTEFLRAKIKGEYL